jgi:hypothetical protein
LLPAARTVPLSGLPPSMTKDCMTESATSVRVTVVAILRTEPVRKGGIVAA